MSRALVAMLRRRQTHMRLRLVARVGTRSGIDRTMMIVSNMAAHPECCLATGSLQVMRAGESERPIQARL